MNLRSGNPWIGEKLPLKKRAKLPKSQNSKAVFNFTSVFMKEKGKTRLTVWYIPGTWGASKRVHREYSHMTKRQWRDHNALRQVRARGDDTIM